jgi:hypothetical protein
MYVCVYVCMYVCMYVSMHVCVCIYACACVCMHACMYACVRVCASMRVRACVRTCECSGKSVLTPRPWTMDSRPACLHECTYTCTEPLVPPHHDATPTKSRTHTYNTQRSNTTWLQLNHSHVSVVHYITCRNRNVYGFTRHFGWHIHLIGLPPAAFLEEERQR